MKYIDHVVADSWVNRKEISSIWVKYVSTEDSVVTIEDSMKLYEVKSVFIITDFKQEKNVVI